jgi:hypothetical protein
MNYKNVEVKRVTANQAAFMQASDIQYYMNIKRQNLSQWHTDDFHAGGYSKTCKTTSTVKLKHKLLAIIYYNCIFYRKAFS